MNKAELIKSIAEKAQMTQKDTGIALDAAIGAITDALSNGDKVQFIGFGTFEVRSRKERKVISPATKQEILVPAKNVPVFKPGKSLKEAVNTKAKPKGSRKKK